MLSSYSVFSTYVHLGGVTPHLCWFAVFIMCGSPMDLLGAKNGTKEADSSDILFLLIDLYKSVFCNRCLLPTPHRAPSQFRLSLHHCPPHSDQYYTNMSSLPSMQNVLVLTMPNTRNYTINTDVNSDSMVRMAQYSQWVHHTHGCRSHLRAHSCSLLHACVRR